jgi:hypothetical protein
MAQISLASAARCISIGLKCNSASDNCRQGVNSVRACLIEPKLDLTRYSSRSAPKRTCDASIERRCVWVFIAVDLQPRRARSRRSAVIVSAQDNKGATPRIGRNPGFEAARAVPALASHLSPDRARVPQVLQTASDRTSGDLRYPRGRGNPAVRSSTSSKACSRTCCRGKPY